MGCNSAIPYHIQCIVIIVGSIRVYKKMDIRKKEAEGVNISVKLDKIRYKKMMDDIKKLGKKYEFQSNLKKLDYSILSNCQKLPFMPVKGWCSRVVDSNGKVSEVIFLDYDNILYRLVESELKYLIEEYNLSPFYVFISEESKDEYGEIYGNYMAICLTKKTFREVVKMQDELHCDQAYKKIPLIYRFKTWVLRLGAKGKKLGPKFKTVIGNLSKDYKQDVSQAHLEALKGLYPEIPKINYTNLDKNNISKLFVTEYVTASK
jgi:hypothetical protein